MLVVFRIRVNSLVAVQGLRLARNGPFACKNVFRFISIHYGPAFCHAKPSWRVSSLGRVQDTRGRISLGTETVVGYRTAKIDGKTYLVHRLVARTFFGPPPSDKRH